MLTLFRALFLQLAFAFFCAFSEVDHDSSQSQSSQHSASWNPLPHQHSLPAHTSAPKLTRGFFKVRSFKKQQHPEERQEQQPTAVRHKRLSKLISGKAEKEDTQQVSESNRPSKHAYSMHVHNHVYHVDSNTLQIFIFVRNRVVRLHSSLSTCAATKTFATTKNQTLWSNTNERVKAERESQLTSQAGSATAPEMLVTAQVSPRRSWRFSQKTTLKLTDTTRRFPCLNPVSPLSQRRRVAVGQQ